MLVRPYDKFIPSAVLPIVRRRRDNPTGLLKRVKTKRNKNGDTVLLCPWDDMELGDFFLVKAENKTRRHNLMTGFRHVAKRRDWELVVRDWEVDGEPGLRVTLTLKDVSVYKRAMARHKVRTEP